MSNKTTQQLIDEFLTNGGKIEKLEPIEYEERHVVRSTVKKAPELMTLEEAENLFGKKQVKQKKVKVPDFSNININLIPEHLRGIIKQTATTKEELIETDKNSRCTKASDEG